MLMYKNFVPVALPEKPKTFFIDLLNAFRAVGEVRPVIYGGALRDQFLGISPRDVDMRIEMDDGLDSASLAERMQASGLFVIRSEPELSCLGDTSLRVRFAANFRGQELDIIQENISPDVDHLIMIADAPLNALAIDPDDGVIKAHPAFIDDVFTRTYRSSVRDAADRFARLSRRIENLRFIAS